MKTFIITEERLLELLKSEGTLYALQACGVDNWSGGDEVGEFTNYDLMDSESVELPVNGVSPNE